MQTMEPASLAPVQRDTLETSANMVGPTIFIESGRDSVFIEK